MLRQVEDDGTILLTLSSQAVSWADWAELLRGWWKREEQPG